MASESREQAIEPSLALASDANSPPFVVGIGASSGGVEALLALFSELPEAPNVAFVVVIHLSPRHDSRLDELLQQCTPMPVCQVTSTVALEPNRVYVIPPNANLNAIDTHLRLSQLEERRVERAPIDHFLRTLATAQRSRAIGVILTGDGSDGALGLRRIRELGGFAIAQEPSEAPSPSMPQSAIVTGLVDRVLPLREIGPEILRLSAARPQLPLPGSDGELEQGYEAALEELVEHLRRQTGQDFAVFRPPVIVSRVRRRMQLNHVATLAAYLELVRGRPDETSALCKDLLFTVTEFFGDAPLFDRLERDVIPRIFDAKNSIVGQVRVWSIGCSTGEEAFSVAMLLLEEAGRRDVRPKLQVFATDLSEEVLQRARTGVYPSEIAAEISPSRLARFFVREGDHFRVSHELRDVVVFAAQNLFRDPPYSRIDLVLCRHLLRELQPEVRSGVMTLLHYALESDAVLVVGRDDPIGARQLFAPDDASLGLYRRLAGARRLTGARPPFGAFAHSAWSTGAPAAIHQAAGGRAEQLATLHEHVLDRYLPPSLVVNDANDVVHYSRRASAYVRFPGGVPTHNVLKLVREPLRSPLRRALVQVRQTGEAWHSPPLDVRTDHGLRRIVLHVEPAAEGERGGLLVVLFDERSEHQRDSVTPSREILAIDAIARLEDELERANSRIRSLLAGTDGGQHDLPLSNETLKRANDELRFILEELEGSREELQAANEELITLDAENRRKIEELAELSGDLKHLLESTGVATLLLDRELRIVRFTPQLSEVFNVTLLDRGRPLSDLTHALHYDELEADLQRVLQNLSPVDHEVEGRNGRWYLTRMLPYRTAAGDVEGVVLTLIDITDRKQVEEKLRDADRRKDEFLALLAHELRNPLAPITTGIEILSRVGGDPRMVGQITATMARQSRTLVRLVDDLLDVSRITGGRLRLSKAPTSIGDVVRDAVAAVRPIIERAGHELIVSVPDEDIVVNADATRLAQVLGNLLNNAARYTPKHGRIELRAVREGDEVLVTVADNGVGMSEDIRGRVFDMFFQGNDPRLVRNAGLGIGLTLARSLVEMHGGAISVESPGLDCGSVFTVRLPVASAAALPAAACDCDDPEAVAGHRVLIVDDNADAAETLRMLVSTFGDNDVRTAFSGPDALAKSVDMHPDIVLLDLKMPGMDGFEVARRLRAQPGGSDMTIVAVTGWGQEEHKRRTREAGFDSHLTKPADRAELEAVLAGSLKTKEPPASYAS